MVFLYILLVLSSSDLADSQDKTITAAVFGTRVLVGEGDSVTLSCDVESNPPSSVSWRKLEKSTRYVSNEPSFTISSVTRTSAGSYQCVAENELGLSQPETIVLDVQCKFIKTSPI